MSNDEKLWDNKLDVALEWECMREKSMLDELDHALESYIERYSMHMAKFGGRALNEVYHMANAQAQQFLAMLKTQEIDMDDTNPTLSNKQDETL